MENQRQWTKEFVKEEFHQHNILMEQEFHELKLWAEGTFITRSEFHIRFDDLENRVEKIEIAINAINCDVNEMQEELKSIKQKLEELRKQKKGANDLENRIVILEKQVLELKTAN